MEEPLAILLESGNEKAGRGRVLRITRFTLCLLVIFFVIQAGICGVAAWSVWRTWKERQYWIQEKQELLARIESIKETGKTKMPSLSWDPLPSGGDSLNPSVPEQAPKPELALKKEQAPKAELALKKEQAPKADQALGADDLKHKEALAQKNLPEEAAPGSGAKIPPLDPKNIIFSALEDGETSEKLPPALPKPVEQASKKEPQPSPAEPVETFSGTVLAVSPKLPETTETPKTTETTETIKISSDESLKFIEVDSGAIRLGKVTWQRKGQDSYFYAFEIQNRNPNTSITGEVSCWLVDKQGRTLNLKLEDPVFNIKRTKIIFAAAPPKNSQFQRGRTDLLIEVKMDNKTAMRTKRATPK